MRSITTSPRRSDKEQVESAKEQIEEYRRLKNVPKKPHWRALYIGRFQPFHNAHLGCVRQLLQMKGVTELIIAIGSAQESWTAKNPFTAAERYQMIRASLIDANLWESCYLIPVVDVPSNHLWVESLKGILPPWDIVFSNNTLSRALFKREGSIVEPPEVDRGEGVSSSKIRKLMVVGNIAWSKYVPKAVSTFILDHNLEERIKAISKEE